ncbi:hypothetical protein BH11MYX4_BH11MYX4_12350 [soil metagenome]
MKHAVESCWDVPLPPAEFAEREAHARASLAGSEGEEMRAYMEWFLRRYPTPLARLRYCRRKLREATAHAGAALISPSDR